MTFHCPISTLRRQMCDEPALYLVQGTALCRDHAKEAYAEFAPPDGPQPPPATTTRERTDR